MNLTCVKCTSVLDKARVGDVEVDLCPSCGGLWLDHGEIERLGRGKPEDSTRLRIGARRHDGARSGVGHDDVVPGLPRPAQRMDLGPVHIEYCGKCHGIFLDKGELDEAVKAVAGIDGASGADARRVDRQS